MHHSGHHDEPADGTEPTAPDEHEAEHSAEQAAERKDQKKTFDKAFKAMRRQNKLDVARHLADGDPG